MTEAGLDLERLRKAAASARQHLISRQNDRGHWEGHLSSSALSTATAIGALCAVAAHSQNPHPKTTRLVAGGLRWLAENMNEDGSWGDTVLSFGNISTTTLGWAAFGLADADQSYHDVVHGAETWISEYAGSVLPMQLAPAITRRYGKDKTFSVPILTMCAISGRLGKDAAAWRHIPQLPFELAAFPQGWFAALRLPVVSYALPALISMGLARHVNLPSRNPLARSFRDRVTPITLEVLSRIQPTSGGFLEATPLTSFVAMSLAAAGHADHPVTRNCLRFIADSVRNDGSWPIDTNLATWATTLSLNAMLDGKAQPAREPSFEPALDWLLSQQYREFHPYTNAAPGGWAWTDLSGGVPDADDTSGAVITLARFHQQADEEHQEQLEDSAENGLHWLFSLQNSDGGIPTFCRGWTRLPFDMSSPDITAHTLRAWAAWQDAEPDVATRCAGRARNALRYLIHQQHSGGYWTPLWFGNQHEAKEENPLYGTSKVLLALAEPRVNDIFNLQVPLTAGLRWMINAQDPGGGWSGFMGGPPSIEETALAIEALAACLSHRETLPDGLPWDEVRSCLEKGLAWLLPRVESGEWKNPSPIGFYFAKLWYYEELYPVIYVNAALANASKALKPA